MKYRKELLSFAISTSSPSGSELVALYPVQPEIARRLLSLFPLNWYREKRFPGLPAVAAPERAAPGHFLSFCFKSTKVTYTLNYTKCKI